MNFLSSFWIFAILIQGTLCVKITNFFVPKYYVIREDTFEPLILDCEYQLEAGENEVVVKWLKDDSPIYQWIYGSKPNAFPRMREQIESSYAASEDEFQKYRALSIKNPTWNNSGIYECRVHTKTSTDFSRGYLQVIDISNFTIEVSHDTVDNETEILCEVSNIYPKPKLSLWTTEFESVLIKAEHFKQNENGFFDAAVTGSLGNSEESSGNSIECSLQIPGTNFTTSSFVYSSANPTAITTSVINTLLVYMIFICIIKL